MSAAIHDYEGEFKARYKAARQRLFAVPSRQGAEPPPVVKPVEVAVSEAADGVKPEPKVRDRKAEQKRRSERELAAFLLNLSPDERKALRRARLHLVAYPIVAEVAARHGVAVDLIFSAAQFSCVVRARHEAVCAVASAFPEWSLLRLGRFFARHHSSILSCLRKAGIRPPPSADVARQSCAAPVAVLHSSLRFEDHSNTEDCPNAENLCPETDNDSGG